MNEHYEFVNPPLPYAYDALEPYIDTKTMELHHNRHLQAYIDNLNKILKDYPEYQNLSLEKLIISINALPSSIQEGIKNNAGGVYNHIFFFSNMVNSDMGIPSPLSEFINQFFGNYNNFKDVFSDAAMSVFGSGYAWLVLNPLGQLQIITTANQDTPFPLNLCPLLNLDVWEHAYYLKHYNLRADYIKNWFHVVNWQQVNSNLINCLSYIS